MHVLHLVECSGLERGTRATSDAEVGACVSAIQGIAGAKHEVWLVADSRGEQHARKLGLPTRHRVTAPLGYSALAWRGLRALAARRRRPDVVQPWGPGMSFLARLVFGQAAGVAASPSSLSAGCAPGPTRSELRESLRLASDDFIVLLLADPMSEAMSARFTFLVGLLDFTGRRAAGVVPFGAPGIARARAFHRRAVLECPIRYSSLPWGVLGTACDVGVLHVSPNRGEVHAREIEHRRALVRSAHLAGLPVVAPAHALVSDVCEVLSPSGAPGFTCQGDKPSDYARSVAALFENREALAAAADTLRSRSHASRGATLQTLARSWEVVAGRGLALEGGT